MEVLHKTQCITCKKTIAEIQRANHDLKTRDFFKEPFTEAELVKIVKMTGKTPSQLLRKRDKMYKQLGLDGGIKPDAEIIKLMVRYPGLIMRPIIIMDGKATVGKIDITGLA